MPGQAVQEPEQPGSGLLGCTGVAGADGVTGAVGVTGAGLEGVTAAELLLELLLL